VTRQTELRPEFVTFAPAVLELGMLYVSMEYATVLHTCCCGCGSKVVTPLAPERWSLTYDGKTISLEPSIGNWSFPCQSHYWIKRNAVIWDRPFSRTEIEAVRATDRRELRRAAHFGPLPQHPLISREQLPMERKPVLSWWRRMLRLHRD
jgi:Family of unknown function (DUF6527)